MSAIDAVGSEDPVGSYVFQDGASLASAASSDETVHAAVDDAARDIAAVPASELIMTVSVHLMSAAAVKLGLGEDEDAGAELDLDEARKLIDALAGLVVGGAAGLGDVHARPIRDGLRSLQLAFREASTIPDDPGKGPGEKWTGSVV